MKNMKWSVTGMVLTGRHQEAASGHVQQQFQRVSDTLNIGVKS
jgi:hypothetical protein